jgi:hypothetical protein
VYATDDPTLRVVFKLEEYWMGSVVETDHSSVQFTIYCESEGLIEKMEILTKQGLCAQAHDGDAHSIFWEPELVADGDTFFYLKVTTSRKWLRGLGNAGRIAVTAPVWLTNRS